MKILYIDHHAALPSSGGDCRAVQLAQDEVQRRAVALQLACPALILRGAGGAAVGAGLAAVRR